MIVITDEERKILELFDTAQEFKVWLEATLNEIREELIKEGEGEPYRELDSIILRERISLLEEIQSCHVEVI